MASKEGLKMIFGRQSLNARSLTQKVVGGFDRKRAAKDWTAEILRVLRELGKRNHFYVSPDPDIGQCEYLVDMMWQKKQKPGAYPVVLAIESERDWGDLDDFEKLMHIKAPQKLFVLRSRRHSKGLQFISDVEQKYMTAFTQHVSGEEYVLLEFAKREGKAFRYKYTVPRAADGLKNCIVRFREIRPPISY
jgi:hypothetical protein